MPDTDYSNEYVKIIWKCNRWSITVEGEYKGTVKKFSEYINDSLKCECKLYNYDGEIKPDNKLLRELKHKFIVVVRLE